MKRPLKCVTAALLVLFGFALLAASVHAQSTFVYTNNNAIPNTATAFSVGPGGTLIMVPGSPFPTGGDGSGVFRASNTATVTVRKRILYVSNDGTNDISGFSINTTTGALTPVSGSPFATGGFGLYGISLAVTPNGKFVYAGNAGSGDISAFSVGSNGALTPIVGSPFPLGNPPDGIKVSPNGKFLGVALPFSDSVAMFRIGSNGGLTSVPGSPFPQGGTGGADAASSVDMSCKSNLLFAAIGNLSETEVGVSTIASSGALSPIAGSPFAFFSGAGVNSEVGILSPKNQWLFVSNQDSNTITSLDLEANGGLAPVSGSPFLNAGTPSGMATNAEGTLLYVANDDNNMVTGFRIDNSNGSLSPVPGSPFPTVGGGLLKSLTTFPAKRVEGEGDENGDDGHKGHFRFEAEHECKASSGMEFQENDSGKGMKGSVDTYTVVGNTATITGAGTLLDGTPVHYTAIVLGNAPVIGANRFAISWVTSTLSVFHTSGALTDGYIAVHAP